MLGAAGVRPIPVFSVVARLVAVLLLLLRVSRWMVESHPLVARVPVVIMVVSGVLGEGTMRRAGRVIGSATLLKLSSVINATSKVSSSVFVLLRPVLGVLLVHRRRVCSRTTDWRADTLSVILMQVRAGIYEVPIIRIGTIV